MAMGRSGTYEAHNNCADDHIPRSVRLKWTGIWEFGAIVSLCLHTCIEAHVCESNTEPGHQTSNGCHVGKPSENLQRSRFDAHVRKRTEQRAEGDRNIRKPSFRRASKNFRRVAGNRKAICIWIGSGMETLRDG
jgi:hypothetical protein